MKTAQIALLGLLSAFQLPAYSNGSGDPVPNCPIKERSSSQVFDAKNFNGKIVVVDFWATWCPPCLQSIPFFSRLKAQFPSETFEMISINVDEDQSALSEFLAKRPISYPVFLDPTGDCAKTWALKAMPSTYVIDKQGRISKVHLGFREQDQEEIVREIEQLLNPR